MAGHTAKQNGPLVGGIMEDDSWHDNFAIENARADVARLAGSIVSMCQRIDWEKLKSSSRPHAVHAAIVTDLEKLIERVRLEDAQELDRAIREIEKEGERNKRLRWYNHCIFMVVSDAIAFARELVRNDNAHRARLATRKDTLRSAILEAAEAWKDRGRD